MRKRRSDERFDARPRRRLSSSSSSSTSSSLLQKNSPLFFSLPPVFNPTPTYTPTRSSPTEGVLFAEKDFNLPEHPEIPGVPNLQVIKLMQSLKSKEHVTERFAWRHYYWFLTDEG